MTISQFFILSSRGDSIISKDFRGDGFQGLQESFFRKVKIGGSECPPIFFLDGITYTFIRRNGLFIACTTRFNVSPSHTLELLNRLCKGFKDYCGLLTEEAIRKNFTLIYELLDEMMDYGYPQTTSTEALKMYIHNEAQIVDDGGLIEAANYMLSSIALKTKPSSATNMPISSGSASKQQKNEIYVDIIEKLTVLFNVSGVMMNSYINGSINMKSFLAGNPELKLALNEDLIIGGQQNGSQYGPLVLDDCSFHECVRLDEFENLRTLHFFPPDGEFSVLNYRVATDFNPPFRISPSVDEIEPTKLLLTCIIRADLPEGHHGANVSIKIPVPRSTVAVYPEVSSSSEAGVEGAGCAAEYIASDKYIMWNVRKFVGATDVTLRAKITLDGPVSAFHKKEIGPIAMAFEIPMYNVSNLQVRYLRIAETHKSYNPQRWVRYITQSSSYVCRL